MFSRGTEQWQANKQAAQLHKAKESNSFCLVVGCFFLRLPLLLLALSKRFAK